MKTKVLHTSQDCKFVEVEQKNTAPKKIYKTPSTKRVLYFDNPVYVVGRMSIVGKKEGNGPLGKYFDIVEDDPKMGQKNFEQAEIKFLEQGIIGAINKAGLAINDIDLLISGDLINQITTSNYVARNLQLPFLGLYSACSSMTQALAVGATMIDAGHCQTVVCGVSSHFASAERQFRMPLEYGGQKPPYAQWTVTGAGCTVLSSNGNGVRITQSMFGKVIDLGTDDLANMGAAMAPAFVHTLLQFLEQTQTSISDYDLIVSGDLGKLGSDIVRTMCTEQGIYLGQNYIDCGAIIYQNNQNAYQGGSGCACSATVVNSFVLPRMENGMHKKVLYLATGALMSPQSCFQGESIPCISHAVLFEA